VAASGRRLRTWTRPLRHGLAYAVLRGVVAALGWLPLSGARALGAGLGRVVGRLAVRPRSTAVRGFEVVGASARVGDHFADLGRRFVEVARGGDALPLLTVPDALREALRARPVLVLTAHHGNWELLGAALAAAGVEVHSVAARVGRGPLHRWLTRHRAAAGMVVHPPGGGARTALTRLRAGHPVAIFFDLDTREKARTVEFLGRPTRFSRTAERLLAASGATAVRAWTRLGPDGRYTLDWAPLVSADPLAEAAAALEAQVRADPTQWVWLVDRWDRPS
jgi:KDO2-lipid IV(A) lauroyltransferase